MMGTPSVTHRCGGQTATQPHAIVPRLAGLDDALPPVGVSSSQADMSSYGQPLVCLGNVTISSASLALSYGCIIYTCIYKDVHEGTFIYTYSYHDISTRLSSQLLRELISYYISGDLMEH